MSRVDYTQIIEEIVQPKIVQNVVLKNMDKLYDLFTKNTDVRSGSRITQTNNTAKTSAGGQFTRADANPASLTQTWEQPYWNKDYFHEAVKIRREDISEAKEGTPLTNLIMDATNTATELLMANVFDAIIAQVKLDVDSASTYSDAALTRTTIFQSYEDDTDTAMTLALMRAAQDALKLRQRFDPTKYLWLLETAVKNITDKLTAAQGADSAQWRQINPQGDVISGYQNVPTFDQIRVEGEFGMTTGDAFLLRRENVQIQEHMPYMIEDISVSTGEFALEFVVRIGINGWVEAPRYHAKLTNKD
jgi:hypothetical protein